MTLTRLFVVLGPLQLLNAIAVLRQQAESGVSQPCRDYLVIGNLVAPHRSKALVKNLQAICAQLAQLWPFESIIYSFELETQFYQGNLTFPEAINQARSLVGLDQVDQLYVIRNWQFFNDVFLAAYPEAYKVSIGDGYGIFDINFPEMIPSYPGGFLPIDAALLPEPGIEMTPDAFQLCPVESVGFEYFDAVIQEAAKLIPGLDEKVADNLKKVRTRPTIVFTSCVTEHRFTPDLESEINLDLSLILQYVKPDEEILIKGHPREAFSQSEILKNRLRQYGFQADTISDLGHVPAELFIQKFAPAKVLSLGSVSSIFIAYAIDCDLVVGLGKSLVQRYIKPEFWQSLLTSETFMRLAIQQACQRSFSPIRSAEYEPLIADLPEAPLFVVKSESRFSDEWPVSPNQPAIVASELAQLRAEMANLKTSFAQTQAHLQQVYQSVQQFQGALDLTDRRMQSLESSLIRLLPAPLQAQSQPIAELDLSSIPLAAVNLIAFPDWQQDEAVLQAELGDAIQTIGTHPGAKHLGLLLYLDTQADSEAAELLLSGILMAIAMDETIDLDEELQVSFLGPLHPSQWRSLQPHLNARLAIEAESLDLTIQNIISQLPALSVNELSRLQLNFT